MKSKKNKSSDGPGCLKDEKNPVPSFQSAPGTRPEADKNIRQGEEQLRSVLENMSEGIMLFDPQANVIYQNPASLRIHGYTSAEDGRIQREELPTVFKGWDKTGRPLSFEEWPIARVCRHERFQDQVLRALRVDTGHEWFASYNGCPIFGADGKLRLGFITIRDITDQVRAEEESRQLYEVVAKEKDRLSALVNSISDEIWFADAEEKITLVNPAVIQEFDPNVGEERDVEKIAARYEVYRGDGTPRPVDEAPPLRALRGEVVKDQEEIVRTPVTGELRHRQVNAAPVRDARGAIIGSVSVVRDITERKRAEEALRENEDRLRLALEAADLGTWDLDLVTGKAVRSLRHDQIFGYQELQPEWTLEIALRHVLPEDRQRTQDAHTPAEGKTRMYVEGRMQRTDGSMGWFMSTGRFLYNSEGHPVRIIGVCADITERKQAEEALRESVRREGERAEELATMMEAIPTPVIIVHDPEATHMTGNRAANELLRQPHGAEASLSAPPEVRPGHFRAIKDGRELRLDELPAQRAAQGEHVQDFEFSLVFDDGITSHLLGYGTPLLDEQNRPRGAVHVLVDITERKQAEVLLQRQADLLHLSYDAIIVWKLGGRIEIWNKGAEELYGYSAEEAVGQVTHDLLKTIHPEPWPQIEAKLREQKFWEGELKHRTHDGREVIVSARKQIFRDTDGVERVLETNRDITERKRAEEQVSRSPEDVFRIGRALPVRHVHR